MSETTLKIISKFIFRLLGNFYKWVNFSFQHKKRKNVKESDLVLEKCLLLNLILFLVLESWISKNVLIYSNVFTFSINENKI